MSVPLNPSSDSDTPSRPPKHPLAEFRYILWYALGILAFAYVLYVPGCPARILLPLDYIFLAFSLPFILIPVPRFFTKRILRYMKTSNPPKNSDYFPSRAAPRSDSPTAPRGFVAHLHHGNLALALLRATFILGTSIVFLRVLSAWMALVQRFLLTAEKPLRGPASPFLDLWTFFGLLLVAYILCWAALYITARLLNKVTSSHHKRTLNDYEEIVHHENTAVALVHASFYFAIFVVLSEISSRLLGVLYAFLSF